MNVLNGLNVIMVIMGGWLTVVTLTMKKTGKVPSLLIPEEERGKLQDHKAFISRIYVPMLVFSLAMTAAAAIGLILTLTASVSWYRYPELLIFLGTLFWFLRSYQDALADLVRR